MLITIYEVIIVAMLTGVILTFYIEFIRIKEKETIDYFHEELEKLPELSRDELKSLSAKIKDFNSKNK